MIFTPGLRLALLLTLLVSPLPLAGQPAPKKPSTEADGAEAPRPNEGPADPAQQQAGRMQDLLRQAETWRGLRSKREVPSATLDEKQLAKEVDAAFREDLPTGELRSMEVSLKAFGLVPESLDLATFLPKLLTREIAGYYDPEKDAMSLVRRDGGVLGGIEEEVGLDARQAEDMVLVHELTHALQDQHFDLERFVKADPMSDEATARQALVEGDATLTMLNALIGIPFEELPGAAGLLESTMGASGEWVTGSSEELDQAPPFIRETLVFSYVQGNLFCISVRQAGGQKLLDYAFRVDPPRSSEQILHPEKWHGRRDDPVDVEWPDLAAVLPGFTKAAEGEMGELPIRILLREALGDAARAEAAAAGWGGDRFAVYERKSEKDGRRLLAWITEWDSETDAAELAEAARHLGEDWKVERPAPQRVVLLRGELPEKQVAPLLQRLAQAKAERPANRGIDLAALGIKDEDKAGANPDKLVERLQDPMVRERIAELTGQSGGKAATGAIAEDGVSFANPTFSIRLPESAVAAGWQLVEAPSEGVVVMAQAGDSQSWIGFGQQTLPVDAFSMGDILSLFETGFRASVPDYKSLGGKEIETASGKVYESQFEGGDDEVRMRGLLRLYARGSVVVFGAGMSRQESWKEAEPVLRSILEAVALTPEPVKTGG